jgi:hypothetical protein
MTNDNADGRLVLPTGPLLGLLLVGLLVLSGIIYYRAIKIQRFLEPALAISEPRTRFSQNINDLLLKEFGPFERSGIRYRTGSILIESSVFFESAHSTEGGYSKVLKKLSHFFLSALGNPEIRDHIGLILVSTRFPISSDSEFNKKMRFFMQERAELVLTSLFTTEPGLEKNFGAYFSSSALPVASPEIRTGEIEIRMVPTELLHVEVLQRLEKYAE